ncbi:cystatin-A-like [Hoplias malabaricus]|uniref:cystatin-A-like n=1 Tax=Hoplias malabaricus TaxID=27720 RepID=UPI00346270F3
MTSRFCLLLVVVLFVIAESAPTTPQLGGWSEWKNADNSVNEICRKLQPEVQKQLGEEFSRFEALTYQTQVAGGVNYRIKVDVGVNKLVIIEVHQDLNQVDTLTKVEVVSSKNSGVVPVNVLVVKKFNDKKVNVLVVKQ